MFAAIMLATTTPILATTTPMVATSALQLQQQSRDTAQSEQDKSNESEASGPTSTHTSTTTSSRSGPSSAPVADERSDVQSETPTGGTTSPPAPTSNVGPIRNKVFALHARASPSATESQKEQLKNKRVFITGQRMVLNNANRSSRYDPSNFQLQLQGGDEDILVAVGGQDSNPMDVHVDSSSYQVLVGSREEHAHIREPMLWNLAPDEEGGLVLQARRAFIAIEEHGGEWVLHFDVNENGLLENRPRDEREVVPVDLLITAASG